MRIEGTSSFTLISQSTVVNTEQEKKTSKDVFECSNQKKKPNVLGLLDSGPLLNEIRNKTFTQFRAIMKEEGSINTDRIKEMIIDIFDKVKQLNIDNGLTTGISDEDNKYIMMTVYNYCRESACNSAIWENNDEGESILNKNGISEKFSYDWVYYNAKYYEKTEDIINILNDFVKERGKEYNFTDIVTENKKIGYTKDVTKMDFNNAWEKLFGRTEPGMSTAKMLNKDAAPPKNFTFFYLEKFEALYTTEEEYKQTGRVVSGTSLTEIFIVNGQKTENKISHTTVERDSMYYCKRDEMVNFHTFCENKKEFEGVSLNFLNNFKYTSGELYLNAKKHFNRLGIQKEYLQDFF